MKCFDFIKDEKELRWFYDHIFVQPTAGESYMEVLSARNKALTEDERKLYHLGRSEMMKMEVLKGGQDKITWERFLSFCKRFNFDETSMLTDSGLPYPEKALVLYWYINPSSEIKVADELIKYIMLNKTELLNAYERSSKNGIIESKIKISKISYMSKSLHACCPSTKYYVDFDLDCDREFLKKNYLALKSVITTFFASGSFFIAETKGGWHILVKHEQIKFNPTLFCNSLIEAIKNLNGEATEYDSYFIDITVTKGDVSQTLHAKGIPATTAGKSYTVNLTVGIN